MWGRHEADRALLVDAMLMVALTAGPMRRAQFDLLQELLADPDALQGWDWVNLIDRAEQLAAEAPLFFDSRPQVVEQLNDKKGAAKALEAGARLAAADSGPDESTEAIFRSLAAGLQVEDAQWIWERAQATASAGSPFVRSRYNDPLGPQPADLFDAIAETRNEDELRLLMFKLVAVRDAYDWGIPAPKRMTDVGALYEVGDCRLRFDAEVDCVGRKVRIRALAKGEALYPEEHEAMKTFVFDQMRSNDSVIIAHADTLSVADAALVAIFSPGKLQALQVG